MSSLKSASVLTILRPLLKTILPFSHFLTRLRFTSVALVSSLICPRLRPCWLGAWKDRLDEPLGLTWVRKMKILGVFFGTVDVERDNWEPRLSKLDKTLSRWKSRSLSFIGKVLILNILALSKLLYVSRVLVPPKWVYSKLNSLIWPFLWRARLETVARKSLICSVDSGGLGLKEFSCQGRALRLAALVTSVSDSSSKCFYLAKYFCGSVLAPLRPEWAGLRDNLTLSAAHPTAFYGSVLSSFRATDLPPGFIYTSRVFSAPSRFSLPSGQALSPFGFPFLGIGI